MEQPIKNQREKLVISFSGCSKDDKEKTDKSNSTDRIAVYKGTDPIKSYNSHAHQYASQLSYKF